jgi:Tfp pilus assembly protein PilZ
MSMPLHEVNKTSVKPKLVELINDMSEAQCRKLFEKLQAWTQKNRREHPRQPCSIPVEYATKDQGFKGFIRDLSHGGVFIQTRGSLEVGEEITMTFSTSSDQDPLKVDGEIVRKNLLGVGVRFKQAVEDFGDRNWIDCRRKISEVDEEKRIDPRVEYKSTVEIEGFRGEMIITDLSLGGVFIECQFAFQEEFQLNQIIYLLMTLPEEAGPVRMQAKIVSFSRRGIHCKFVDPHPRSQEAVRRCFGVAKHTLPIR